MKPIIFSAPMVNAILEGRKTMTRRIVKPQPKHTESGWTTLRYFGDGLAIECGPDYPDGDSDRRVCPYGKPGDRLYVKETHFIEPGERIIYRSNMAMRLIAHMPDRTDPSTESYLSSNFKPEGKWRSSRYMPRWASRITLTITDIRVERVQDISEADAKAEGAMHRGNQASRYGLPDPHGLAHDQIYKRGFAYLWDDINGPGSWEANPWVWVVSFERTSDREYTHER